MCQPASQPLSSLHFWWFIWHMPENSTYKIILIKQVDSRELYKEEEIKVKRRIVEGLNRGSRRKLLQTPE